MKELFLKNKAFAAYNSTFSVGLHIGEYVRFNNLISVD